MELVPRVDAVIMDVPIAFVMVMVEAVVDGVLGLVEDSIVFVSMDAASVLVVGFAVVTVV